MLVPIQELDESSLARQIREGNRQARGEAFEELFRRHGRRLQHYLAWKGLSHHEREDVAAEAWTRAWRGLDRYEYRDEIGFLPWLRKFADNIILEFTRKRYLSCGSDAANAELEDVIADASTSEAAIVHLTQAEVQQAIADSLDVVPNDDWRIVIEAHLVDGWQTNEIMELYDWSQSKVYVTKYRAFQWLKDHLLETIGPTDVEAWLGGL